MSIIDTAPHAADAPTSSDQRDDGLWHVVFDGQPDVSLCGMPVGDGEIVPLAMDTGEGECVVCHDLAERYIDGTWSP